MLRFSEHARLEPLRLVNQRIGRLSLLSARRLPGQAVHRVMLVRCNAFDQLGLRHHFYILHLRKQFAYAGFLHTEIKGRGGLFPAADLHRRGLCQRHN